MLISPIVCVCVSSLLTDGANAEASVCTILAILNRMLLLMLVVADLEKDLPRLAPDRGHIVNTSSLLMWMPAF